jgi:signal peptidase I
VNSSTDWAYYFKLMVISFVMVFITNWFLFQFSTVRGNSMRPTLEDGDWLYVNKWTYFHGTAPRVGEVVVFSEPTQEASSRKIFLVKRIIADAGDVVHIVDGRLMINGEEQAENYTDVPIENGDFGPYTVAPDHYFVLGDNRRMNRSKDSRYFGAVPRELILGRADGVLWPLEEMKWLID